MTGLGPSWTGRDHYLAWYRIRSHTISHSESTITEAVPLATLIAAALDPSSTFKRHLRATAVLGAHPTMRRAAVEAIAAGWADDRDTLPLLRERATTDPDGAVRQAAVRVIADGWAGDRDTLPWLCERAATDDNEDVRQAAVQAIAAGWTDDQDTNR